MQTGLQACCGDVVKVYDVFAHVVGLNVYFGRLVAYVISGKSGVRALPCPVSARCRLCEVFQRQLCFDGRYRWCCGRKRWHLDGIGTVGAAFDDGIFAVVHFFYLAVFVQVEHGVECYPVKVQGDGQVVDIDAYRRVDVRQVVVVVHARGQCYRDCRETQCQAVFAESLFHCKLSFG